MIPGITKFPEEPVATLPASLRSSTANQFAALLSNPDEQFIILLIANPYDGSATHKISALPGMVAALPVAGGIDITIDGGESAVYLSDQGYSTNGEDSIPHQLFPDYLSPALNSSITLFNGSEPSGAGTTSIGDIVINNNDGEMDYLLDDSYAFDGRNLKLLAGQKDLRLNQFGTVITGSVASINADDSRITLSMTDSSAFLQLPLQRNKYTGAGGVNGDSDLQGTSRPYAAGRVRNITPVLVSSSDLLYQVNDGQVNAIDAVRDRGVGLTNAGDYGSVDLLLAATTGVGNDIEPGEFATCLTEGFFRLGGQPDGLVTGDVRGDADNGYVNTAGAIVKRIITTRLGAFGLQSNQVDSGSINKLDVAQPAEVGVYVDSDISVAEVISALMNGIGGYWFFKRTGEFSVGRLEKPSAPVLQFDDEDIISIFKMDMPLPVWRRSVTWRKSWTIQSAEDLAGSVSDADRQLYGNEYRYSVNENSQVIGKHRLARDVSSIGFFDAESDADDEAARLNTLHSVVRERYQIKLSQTLFRLTPGDCIGVTYSRFNLSGGKNFIIAVLDEQSEDGMTTVEVWG